MQDIFLLLGSNLGQREKYLQDALSLINSDIGKPIKISSVYKTAAWGNTDQPEFLNQVIYLKSNVSATELLKRVLRIEEILDRKRIKHWGARTIDIDILFYGDEVINEPNLTIPHKLLHQRRFVLMPLSEIEPDFIHPVLNTTIAELLLKLTDDLSVKKIENKY
ncbi:MAG: 2-amino-4-hydroxy-6-hydroxymethyldihydropteridine diphosphokinase [Pyrinomonadaceae bacterium]|nr:2-amino-4-hydroxy-6-hydroxymethyldihydropteridine diphosphokinase [Sphingobacteriaceae bacterium]